MQHLMSNPDMHAVPEEDTLVRRRPIDCHVNKLENEPSLGACWDPLKPLTEKGFCLRCESRLGHSHRIWAWEQTTALRNAQDPSGANLLVPPAVSNGAEEGPPTPKCGRREGLDV